MNIPEGCKYVRAKIKAVNAPMKSAKTGKFGPHRIQVEGMSKTMDTFDDKVVDQAKNSLDWPDVVPVVIYREKQSGQYTNFELVEIR